MSKSKIRATDDLRTRFRPTCDDITLERGLETHSLGVSRDGEYLVNVPRNPAFKRDEGVVARPYLNTSARKSRRPECAPPTVTAEFTAAPLAGDMPLVVTFANTSMNAATYAWTFGDGGTSTAENPQHTYAAEGTYDVTLTATGPGGVDVKTRAAYVAVANPQFTITLKYDFAQSPGGGWQNNHTRAQQFSIASMGQSDVEFYVIGTGHPYTHDYVKLRARVKNLSLIDDEGREEVLVMKAYLQNAGEITTHPRWQYHGIAHANNGAIWNAANTINGLNHNLVKWRSDAAPNELGHSFPATMRTMGNGGGGALLAVLVDLPEFELIDPTDPAQGWKFK